MYDACFKRLSICCSKTLHLFVLEKTTNSLQLNRGWAMTKRHIIETEKNTRPTQPFNLYSTVHGINCYNSSVADPHVCTSAINIWSPCASFSTYFPDLKFALAGLECPMSQRVSKRVVRSIIKMIWGFLFEMFHPAKLTPRVHLVSIRSSDLAVLPPKLRRRRPATQRPSNDKSIQESRPIHKICRSSV